MGEYIKTPNLPQSNVTSAVIGKCNDNICTALTGQGIKLYFSDPNPDIEQSTCCHADMAAYYFGDGSIIVERNQQRLISELKKDGFDVVSSTNHIAGDYPSDIALNCFTVAETLIGRADCIDPKIVKRYQSILSVKQGYAKCSSLILSENAVITDDAQIYKACEALKADCLMIEKGDIFLTDKHYGFIGGASCMLNRSTVAFFGELKTHRDCDKVKQFLKEHCITYIELIDGTLIDIGGIVSLTQSDNFI